MQYGEPNGESIRCEKCGVCFPDSPQVRRFIIERGHWQAQNPHPSQGVVSYHWNALLPPWVRWADLVDEWHRANQAKKQGNIEPLKVFICESLGEPWEERIEVSDYAAISQRKAGYVIGEAWPAEKRRILTADVQKDVIYWSCRAWGVGGVSRLVDRGRVFTFDDLREVQKRLAVKDTDVGVDCGFRTSEVYQQCLRWGWHPMKGAPVQDFTHQEPAGAVRRIWAVSQADPAMGTSKQGAIQLPLFLFSADAAKDMLALFMSGHAAAWELPSDIGDEYLQHMAAERAEIDPKSGKRIWKKISINNHWLDCETMNLIAAVMLGFVASGEIK